MYTPYTEKENLHYGEKEERRRHVRKLDLLISAVKRSKVREKDNVAKITDN